MQVMQHRMIRPARPMRLMAVPLLALAIAALSPSASSARSGQGRDSADVAAPAVVHAVSAVVSPAPPAPPAPPTPPSARRSQRDREDDEEGRAARRAWLGVVLTGETGNRIGSVSEDSPAEEAGLRRGDRIVGIDGEDIDSASDIMRTMRNMNPGDRVKVTVERGDEEKTVGVTLGERPMMNRRQFKVFAPEAFWNDDDDDDDADDDHDSHDSHGELRERHEHHDEGDDGMRRHEVIIHGGPSRNFLGVEIHPMSEELRLAMKAPSDQGVLVNRVIEGSPADEGGIRAGDVIIGVADETVEDAGDIGRALRDREPGDDVSVKVIRGGSERTLEVKVGRRSEHSGLPGRRGFMMLPDINLQGLEELGELRELKGLDKIEGLDKIGIDSEAIQKAVEESVREAMKEAHEAMKAAREAMREKGVEMRKLNEEIRKQQDVIRDQVRREVERERSTIRARNVFDI